MQEAKLYERGNGFPSVGGTVYDGTDWWRVAWMGSHVHTGHVRGNWVWAKLEPARGKGRAKAFPVEVQLEHDEPTGPRLRAQAWPDEGGAWSVSIVDDDGEVEFVRAYTDENSEDPEASAWERAKRIAKSRGIVAELRSHSGGVVDSESYADD